MSPKLIRGKARYAWSGPNLGNRRCLYCSRANSLSLEWSRCGNSLFAGRNRAQPALAASRFDDVWLYDYGAGEASTGRSASGLKNGPVGWAITSRKPVADLSHGSSSNTAGASPRKFWRQSMPASDRHVW